MATDYQSVQGDNSDVLSDTLTYSDGSAVNLTGATLAVDVRSLTASSPLAVTGTVTSPNPPAGAIQYAPTSADTAASGQFMLKWVVVLPGGAQKTFPTQGYNSWSIEPNLTTPGGQQLVSLPDVKEYLGVPPRDRTHDAKLVRYINAAAPLIEHVTGPIIVRTIDEWHPGGQYFIQLRRRPSFALGMSPVYSILACEEYRGPIKYTLSVVPDPAAASIYSVMFDQRLGTLYRRTAGGGVIPFGAGPWGGGTPDGVHVIYQAGQQTVPPNVYEAALEAIRVNYQTTLGTGIGSRSIADEEDRTGPPLGFFLPRRCLELLAPLRRHPSIA